MTKRSHLCLAKAGLLLLLLLPMDLPAQVDSVTLQTGALRVHLKSGGPLLSSLSIPGPGADHVVAVKDVALWFGGVDPGGNLRTVIQQTDPSRSDLVAGFRHMPGSGKIWYCTKEEVRAHLADFADNGVIDQPLPSIYAWPAFGNPHSQKYNGFSTDQLLRGVLPNFFDANQDGRYNPDWGDYPIFTDNLPAYSGYLEWPDVFIYVPLTERIPDGSGLDASVVWLGFSCPEASFLNDFLFGEIKMVHYGVQPLDSMHFGLLVNGAVGDPTDDYLGTTDHGRGLFFYNNAPDAVFGPQTPLVTTHVISETSTWQFDPNGNLLEFWRTFMLPIAQPCPGDPDPETVDMPTALTMPGGAPCSEHAYNRFPEMPIEHYRYLTGRWANGVPVTPLGNGYNPNIPNLPTVQSVFSGSPDNPAEWSERSAGLSPGDRQAIVSTGPFEWRPGAIERIRFAIGYIPYATSLTSQLNAWQQSADTHVRLQYHIHPPDINPFDTLSCFQSSRVVYPQTVTTHIDIFPNPATERIFLPISGIQDMPVVTCVDVFGRSTVLPAVLQADGLEVAIQGLPTGLFQINVTVNDRKYVGKFVRIP